jgi:guanylate kinase
MLILLGPSASGKTESAKIMINRYPISRVVTCTTRPMRVGEIDGFDYQFVDENRFMVLKQQRYFAETAQYNGYYYGTPINQLKDDKLIILEAQGLRSFLDIPNCTIVAIYLQTQEATRMTRMRQRQDKEEDIEKRIRSDRTAFDMNHIQGLDLVIETSNLSLVDLADLVYFNYQRLLAIKIQRYEQLSLFDK